MMHSTKLIYFMRVFLFERKPQLYDMIIDFLTVLFGRVNLFDSKKYFS